MNWPLAIVALLSGFVLLERGAEWFTEHIGKLVERTGLSETVIGLLTAGVEWEEMVVVVVAALSGNVGLAIGDVVGSCVANLTGSFSLGPLVRPLTVSRDDRRFAFALIFFTALAALFISTGQVGRLKGLALLGIFLLYIIMLIWLVVRGLMKVHFETDDDDDNDDDDDDDDNQVKPAKKPDSALRLYGLTLVGLLLIVVGAELVVQAASFIARQLGLSEFVIGVTVVAFGTTLPDKVVSVAAAFRQQSGIVAANAIGSNIFNLYFALGLAALVQPLVFNSADVTFDLLYLMGSTVLFALIYLQKRIGRLSGGLLMAFYVAYIVIKFAS